MVPPVGARTKRIPALSWDSVVDTAGSSATDLGTTDPAIDDPADAGTVELDEPAIAFEPLQLQSPPERPMATAPPASSPIPPSAPPTRAIVEATIVETTNVEEPATVRTTPPAVIVPAFGDVTSGPEQLSPAAVPASAPTSVAPATSLLGDTDVLPQIQEATPVFDTGGPTLPSVAPVVPRPAAAPSFEVNPVTVSPGPTRQLPRRSRRRGLKLVATLVVLGGVVAAGVFFGQSYLFPGDWDGATVPYADVVEAGRDVDFAEPLAIVAESTDDFGVRLRTQLATVSAEELAQWRALGLASGTVDDTTLTARIEGWQGALYSTVDGQVYHDVAVAGAVLDARLVQEMTAASLDQQFGWSVEQPQRTLDAAATTSAEVLRQSRAIQQSSAFDAAVPPVPSEVTDTVPPVIGYRMLAPHVFAEFDSAIEPIEPIDRANPLADLGTDGPGPLGQSRSIAATGPTLPDGDDVTTPPVAKDPSFWYLVFAAFLDARTAHAASEAVVESALTGATRGATQCASATFSGGGVDQTAVLRSALTDWATAAPVELSSSFQVLPDGTLQLVSCDPGAGFDAAVRPAVARELLAWRMAELATREAVRVGGGGDAEFVEAWSFVQASPVAIDLMALPPDTTPTDMVIAAQGAVNSLFTPAD